MKTMKEIKLIVPIVPMSMRWPKLR